MKPINNQDTRYSLEKRDGIKHLIIEGNAENFEGRVDGTFVICPLNAENAAVMRERLPWLKPKPLGLATSFGFGDRLGLATPGHVSAVRTTGISPVFAQQSVRENARTRRTPQMVLDDAMWAVFESNWQEPWGADADHIKEVADLGPFIEAGYTFYTIDPNFHVDNAAHTDTIEVLNRKVDNLPWDGLQTNLLEIRNFYLGMQIQVGDNALQFSEEALYRALGKYGQAIVHIKSLSDYLVQNVEAFDLEASVDETDTPTSVQEHYFIARELRRLEVPFVSLAPRFMGCFEKGVDYIGDIKSFELELDQHARVMHSIGGYKLSIHTGSDKFSIYPSIAEKTKNLVHVKTAGTSYLEALRVVAAKDQTFFREILDFSRVRYEIDRATYHVSGEVGKVPSANKLNDSQLLDLFDDFNARQVLHVTFGSVLDAYGYRLKGTLKENLGAYSEYLETHFKRHLEPFE